MKLSLKENKVNQLILVDAEENQTLDSEFRLNFEPVFSAEDPRQFKIVFDFEYITTDRKYLRIDYQSFFITDSDINDDFHNSTFPVINAPAIAFPFLRAFLANLLISGGYPPVLLPSINFVHYAKENISKPEEF
ncbi:TPA: protein-export chaperone SecB [Providencia alcalifaciens]